MFRKLTTEETSIVARLLETDFPGRDAIAQQMENATVREWDDRNGSLIFEVASGPRAVTKLRIPVEGEFEDLDGITIHVLLHVVDGFVTDLEIYKDDSSRIQKIPSSTQLRIFRPGYRD